MATKSKIQPSTKEKTDILLDFIDEKVFDPILKAPPFKYTGDNKLKLEEVQKKTHDEQDEFHRIEDPKDVKRNYLNNVNSHWAEKVNHQLEDLGLPTLPQYKEEFTKLCEDLEV